MLLFDEVFIEYYQDLNTESTLDQAFTKNNSSKIEKNLKLDFFG